MSIKNTAIKSCVRSYLGGQDHFHSVKGNCQIVAIQDWIYKGTIRHSVENHPRKNVKILYTNTLLCETCKSANFLIFWSMHKFSHSEFQKHDFHICIQQMNQIKYQAGRQLEGGHGPTIFWPCLASKVQEKSISCCLLIKPKAYLDFKTRLQTRFECKVSRQGKANYQGKA